jgi:hypothetical protein
VLYSWDLYSRERRGSSVRLQATLSQEARAGASALVSARAKRARTLCCHRLLAPAKGAACNLFSVCTLPTKIHVDADSWIKWRVACVQAATRAVRYCRAHAQGGDSEAQVRPEPRVSSPSWFPQSLHVPLPPRCPSVSRSWPHSGLLGIPLLPWQPQHTHGSSSPWQQQRDEISRGLLSASPRTDVRIRVQVLSQSRLSPLQCPFYLNWVGLQGLHDQRDSQCSSASLPT